MKLFFGIAAAALLLSSAPAFAQAPPGGVPLGAGFQRGVQGLNNSGQDGYVTLFPAGTAGDKTHIVTALEGTPKGRVQAVTVQRGTSCDSVQTNILAKSADMVKGMSRGDVPIPFKRMTSGNYVVIVYSDNTAFAHPVACGWLFP